MTTLTEVLTATSQWGIFCPVSHPSVLNAGKGSRSKVFFSCPDCLQTSAYSVRAFMRKGVFRCPVCAGKRIVVGVNDLATKAPQIARACVSDPNVTSLFSTVRELFRCGRCDNIFSTSKGNLLKTYTRPDDVVLCPKCANLSAEKVRRRKRLRSLGYEGGKLNPLVTEVFPELQSVVSSESKYVNAKMSPHFVCVKDNGHTWKESLYRIRKRMTCPYCDDSVTVMESGAIIDSPPASVKLSELGILAEWADVRDPERLPYASAERIHWKCSKGHEWDSPLYSRTSSSPASCPTCFFGNQRSAFEREVYEYILSILPDGVEVESSNRNLISPLELDILIPSLNIAFECNGLYWHDDNHVPNDLHYRKWSQCHQAGVQLITVWEDDWRDRRSIVERMIANKLGVSTEGRVYARKCQVAQLSQSEYAAFLNQNHVQGECNSSVRYGLLYDDSLCAVIGFSRERTDGGWYLDRYATSCSVVGGFTKLLSFFERALMPTSVVTFSDNSVSNGGLYSSHGFVEEARIPFSYYYVVDRCRFHKSNYRKQMFADRDDLIFDPSMSETELADLNGIRRVYDCGKIRWRKVLSYGTM